DRGATARTAWTRRRRNRAARIPRTAVPRPTPGSSPPPRHRRPVPLWGGRCSCPRVILACGAPRACEQDRDARGGWYSPLTEPLRCPGPPARAPPVPGPPRDGDRMRPPLVLTIAASETDGAAGLQADLKTFTALGAYGASVVSMVTVVTAAGVESTHP